ncbi:hypothetical protein, partial [Duncaniella sp.]|uniref:hypothetical protein n=1 Tax=Duncaniella sp. TaxID=2518496 RepID=UPI0023BD67A9
FSPIRGEGLVLAKLLMAIFCFSDENRLYLQVKTIEQPRIDQKIYNKLMCGGNKTGSQSGIRNLNNITMTN